MHADRVDRERDQQPGRREDDPVAHHADGALGVEAGVVDDPCARPRAASAIHPARRRDRRTLRRRRAQAGGGARVDHPRIRQAEHREQRDRPPGSPPRSRRPGAGRARPCCRARRVPSWRSGTPSAFAIAASAPICAMSESSTSAGSAWTISRRPKALKIGEADAHRPRRRAASRDGSSAALTVGSPARARRRRRYGRRDVRHDVGVRALRPAPKDSPMSQFKSTVITAVARPL